MELAASASRRRRQFLFRPVPASLAKPPFSGTATPMSCFCAFAGRCLCFELARIGIKLRVLSTARLALQHGFRHYCGSDDVHRPNKPRQDHRLNHKQMRNAAL
jgi:hypothetical protein